MNDNLHSLLTRYGIVDDELGLHAVWCEGRDVQDVAQRLRVDPESGASCRLNDPWRELGELDDKDGVVVVGMYRGWTVILQLLGQKCTRDAVLSILSSGGRRAVGVGWDVNLHGRLSYAVDGRVLAAMELFPPGRPRGIGRQALEAYLEGIPFGDTPDMEAHAVSALRVIERIADGGVDEEWLGATHQRYVIPAGEWYYGW